MRKGRLMIQKTDGFTMIEVLVVIMVFGLLMSGMLTLLSTSASTLESMGNSLTNKSQYQRSVSFISNTIRRNQEKNSVRIKDGGSRVVITLSDIPGNYLHYYKDGSNLVMYIGTEAENLPNLTDDEKKEQIMILAKDIKEISFALESDADTKKNNLRVQYVIENVQEDGTPITTIHVDRINLYVTN